MNYWRSILSVVAFVTWSSASLSYQITPQCQAYGRMAQEFINNNHHVYGITPFSARAIGFAKQYQRMSVALHGYLGEPKVITSLAFEPHVVKEVSIDLARLEKAIQAGKDLRQAGNGIVGSGKALMAFASEMRDLMETPEMRSAVYNYGIKPFFQISPSEWGWNQLDKTIQDLEKLHSYMSAMNMTIFLFMSLESTSPLARYFKTLSECDPNFNGEIDYPNDENGLLKTAFKKLYELKQETDLARRKKLSWEFSTLLIAHEQIYAQTFYDQIKNQHQRLAGLFKVTDPVGTYPLATDSWADFRVRFSLDRSKPIDLTRITADDILNIQLREGTIPAFYKSRIESPLGLRLLNEPIWPK